MDTVIGIVVHFGFSFGFKKQYPLVLFNLSLCISRGFVIFGLLACLSSLQLTIRMNYESQNNAVLELPSFRPWINDFFAEQKEQKVITLDSSATIETDQRPRTEVKSRNNISKYKIPA